MLIYSFVNKVASAAITASSEDAKYNAQTLLEAGRPFYPWRANVVTDSWIQVDFGAPVSLSSLVIFLNRTNYTACRLQWNSSASWGSPPIDDLITVRLNPTNWRYQYGRWQRTSASYQFFRLSIPAQSTTDLLGFFLLGGLWIGDAVLAPNHFDFAIGRETGRPAARPSLEGGGIDLAKTGNPFAILTATIRPKTNKLTPGFDDQLESWASNIKRQQWNAGRTLMQFSQVDTTDTYVMHESGPLVWNRGSLIRASASQTFVESMGP